MDKPNILVFYACAWTLANLYHCIIHQFKFYKTHLPNHPTLITSPRSTKQIAPTQNTPSKPTVQIGPCPSSLKSDDQYYLDHPSSLITHFAASPSLHEPDALSPSLAAFFPRTSAYPPMDSLSVLVSAECT